MDGWLAAGTAGVLAGFGVAVPLGAVSVLLIGEALSRGWRVAAAGASGVAAVDLLYVSLATGAGTVISAALAGHERQVRLAAAAVLAAVAVRGLLRARGDHAPVPGPPGGGDVPAPWAAPAGHEGGAARAFWRFVGITAVNPLTAVYFAALATALGEQVRGAGRGVAFVTGTWIASWAWQLVLVTVGSGARAVLGGAGRRWTALAGNVVVLALAAGLALSA